MSIDIAIVEAANGDLWLHTATCHVAREAAERGFPVLTMLDCQKMPTREDFPRLNRHDCLDSATVVARHGGT